ncbi:MAG: alpha/beta hydrolase [Gammaproteobacteria bacterium]|nr:alpha/beta hydrolase [Gammaproteobacteria bacterium]
MMQDNTMKLNDGRTLGFSDYGNPSDTPILLFHGIPGSRILGLENKPFIDRYGIRVIVPERPGYGLSDPKPERKIKDWVTDVEALANHLGLHQFHVAGGSGGGPYVLACAIHLPRRVLSATLMASATPPEVPHFSKGMASGNRIGFFLLQYVPFIHKILLANYARAAKKNPMKLVQKILPQFCESDRRIIENPNGKGREQLVLHLQEAFRQGIDGAYRDALLLSQPWRLDLSKITVPVFLWHGESDTLVPIAPAREFAKLIPNCESHFIPGAGHLLLESEDIGSQIVARLLSVNA